MYIFKTTLKALLFFKIFNNPQTNSVDIFFDLLF